MLRGRPLLLLLLFTAGCGYPDVGFGDGDGATDDSALDGDDALVDSTDAVTDVPPGEVQDTAAIEIGNDTGIGDTTLDTGVDTGADTGVDTGPLDTGPIDTGTPDTGTPDTGTPDTGPPDTGPADTGSGDTGTPKCRSGAPKVLFYGAVGSKELAYLPTGAVTTVASEATWRAMTTADFATFDLVVIGEPDSIPSGPTAAMLLAAFDTRATWGAAITGRMAVLGVDPAYHAALSIAGASTFTRAALQWLSTGAPSTTALYATSDWGRRTLDYLSPFGAFASATLTADAVVVTVPSHPIMTGSTSASLSGWTQSVHSTVTFPTSFTAVANTGTTGADVVVVRDGPACVP